MRLSSLATHHRPHALNWLFEALGSVVNPNSCDVVVLAGKLGHDRLRAAITATLARHPVLRGQPFQLRFHALPDDDAARVDDHLLGLIWSERLAPDAAPVRFHVTETPGQTYFQTIHTHVHADATACYLLTEQIAASYGGRGATPGAPGPGLASVASPATPGPDRGSRGWRHALAAHARGVAQTARDLRAPFGGLATPRRAAPGRRQLARVTLTPAETDQLRQAARRRGCSIHAFFQLAFLRTATDFNRRRGVARARLRLWDFFSVRPLRGDQAPRYDCLALVYPVELDAAWTDDEVLTRCAATIERLRDGDIYSHAARFDDLFAGFGRWLPQRWFAGLWPALFKSNVMLTNPGVCPSRLPCFGDTAVVDYVTFPQLFAPAEIMLVFSTFRGGLRVLAVYDEAALGAAFHGELFRPFLRRLGELGGLDLAAVTTGDGFVARWSAAAADRLRSA